MSQFVSMQFVAFDLETTGTVPGVDRIVEIGAIRFRDGTVDAMFSTLVDPQIPIPPAASRVNGITDEMLRGQPRILDLLGPLTEFCGDDVLVAHNAPFDFQFLLADYQREEKPTPQGVVLDTCAISRKVYPGLANYKLSTLVEHLRLPSGGFHRAEADATFCGRLFENILKKVGAAAQIPVQNLILLTGKSELRFPVINPQPKQLELSLF